MARRVRQWIGFFIMLAGLGLMAGPFVCHIRLDEVNKRVVFAEGFCYAPNDNQRLLIRNLEAALYTLKLPSDNMMSEIEITLDE